MNMLIFNKNLIKIQQEDLECIHYKRNQVIQERNQLIFIKKSLEDRLKCLRNQLTTKSNCSINQPIQVRPTADCQRNYFDLG